MTLIRYRGKKKILEITRKFDAFGKLSAEYQETSKLGGAISVISRLMIVCLVYKEISYYRSSNLIFTFKPDFNLDSKIRMNVDITIATPCAFLAGPVDLSDDTKQSFFSTGLLKRENTWWELDKAERIRFEEIKNFNKFLREEYHSLANLLFKDMITKEQIFNPDIPKRVPVESNKYVKPYDACRLYGNFLINKVSGLLHFISSETISFGFSNNQWHLKELNRVTSNFSHRINKFSIGDIASRIIQPLEGDETNVPEQTVMQYFIEIVPTEIHNVFSIIDTYQYSVKENERVVDSHKNSYGLPGIYFKYDWSALKVVIKPDRENIYKFLIRLSSVIAGIIKFCGISNNVIQTLHNFFSKKWSLIPYRFKKSSVKIQKI